ncbi:HEPN domain-containing protein [Patescibacteria group bacterium]|nr:HEPN domain-containing protein [Patescibacteria group bacterium]MBU2260166.1 HEPN domain-containing protein [Patescibacteria group bacterium]
MTEADIIAHWRKGAKDAFEMAQLAHKAGKYELALFHCHLAVEKILKAAVMEKTKKPHPKIHELSVLARLLKETWSVEEKQLFESLSDFAIAARYDDPTWAENYATSQNAQDWIKRTEAFLSTQCP